MVELILPYPPTVNHYWKHTKSGRHYVTPKGKAFQLEVWKIGKQFDRLFGAVSVQVDVYLPDKRRRDIDNLLKALLDGLTASGVIEDDSLIADLRIRKVGFVPKGKVVVRIEELSNEG